MMTIDSGRLLVAVGALLAVAGGALLAGRVAIASVPALAVLRGAAQLAVVSLLVGAALTDARAAAALMVVMTAAVAVTAGRRLGGGRRRTGQVLAASLCGAAPVLVVLVASGAFPRTPRYTVAFAGIVLGGTMTVCTLSGRRLRDSVRDRWAEVEAMLALGATPRHAVAPMVPQAVIESLLPAIDQTRTTGLVTLPGTFVGALAGGAGPVAAAQFQVAVLAALLAAQAVSAVVLLHLAAADLARAPSDAAP